MGCCNDDEPKVCCGGGRPLKKDDCTCGCCCLNGPLAITAAQILLFIGWWLSMAAVGDCSFVTIPGGYRPILQGSPGFGKRQGIGMFLFEQDGSCFYYDSDLGMPELYETIFQAYMDFLGGAWGTTQGMSMGAAVVSFFVWCYMLSYSCSSQIRAVRYGTGMVLILICVIFQGLSFVVLTTHWCWEYNCEFSRSAGLSVGALLCFFFAGIAMFLTSDYPGKKLEDTYDEDFRDVYPINGSAKEQSTPEAVVAEEYADEEQPAAAAAVVTAEGDGDPTQATEDEAAGNTSSERFVDEGTAATSTSITSGTVNTNNEEVIVVEPEAEAQVLEVVGAGTSSFATTKTS